MRGALKRLINDVHHHKIGARAGINLIRLERYDDDDDYDDGGTGGRAYFFFYFSQNTSK